MRLRRFLSIVPKTVQLWASVLVGCALLIGLVVGYTAADQGAVLRTMSAYGSAALVLGIVLAIWLLCLGFVFADARRRDMRSVLWVLVAALFPHLLGFLLYFVMRQPDRRDLHPLRHDGLSPSAILLLVRYLAAAPTSTDGPLTANPSSGASQ